MQTVYIYQTRKEEKSKRFFCVYNFFGALSKAGGSISKIKGDEMCRANHIKAEKGIEPSKI